MFLPCNGGKLVVNAILPWLKTSRVVGYSSKKYLGYQQRESDA
jgi:hypothetical protein